MPASQDEKSNSQNKQIAASVTPTVTPPAVSVAQFSIVGQRRPRNAPWVQGYIDHDATTKRPDEKAETSCRIL